MKILSFSAKWLRGRHITKGWIHYKGYKPKSLDDKPLVKELWKLLDEADIVVTQNGRRFDLKLLNTRFLFFSMRPPSPYKDVDLKVEAKKYLRLPSYSLDNMCDYFGIGRKMEHEGFSLWKKCLAGDRRAWERMLHYNHKDVILTEKLYLKLLPYIQNHPNYGLYSERPGTCPNCGSNRTQRAGELRTAKTVYVRIRCRDCGRWSKAEKKSSLKLLS